MNLPNDIGFELLVRYLAELTSPEENLSVEKQIAICPELGRRLEDLHDLLEQVVAVSARSPRQSLKSEILQTIGDWENKRALCITYCLN